MRVSCPLARCATCLLSPARIPGALVAQRAVAGLAILLRSHFPVQVAVTARFSAMASAVRSAALPRIVSLSKDGLSLLVSVSVKPGARSAGVGVGEGSLELRVTAQPQDGEANAAVVKAVAALLGVGKSSVSVVRGHTARQKVLAITGVPLATADAVVARLAADAAE